MADHFDPTATLAAELWDCIFSFLEPKDLLNLSQVRLIVSTFLAKRRLIYLILDLLVPPSTDLPKGGLAPGRAYPMR